MTKTMNTRAICLCGLMAAFISICSLISIPLGQVPVTLQTFGVFTAVGILGGKNGTISVIIYVLLGTIGLPVFAGATGGIGMLVCNSGGYITGFIFAALTMWLIQHKFGESFAVQIVSMAIGMIVCYIFGTLWFMFIYTRANGAVSIITVLSWCVFPFLLPDAIKIALAAILSKRMKKYINVKA